MTDQETRDRLRQAGFMELPGGSWSKRDGEVQGIFSTEGALRQIPDHVPFWEVDRETLREIGTLLDQLDVNRGDDDVLNVLASARLTYLGGYCAGLADREPTFQRYPGDVPRPIPHGPSEPEQT